VKSADGKVRAGWGSRGLALGVCAAATLSGAVAFADMLVASGDPARVWRALLVSFLFVCPISAGLVVWAAVVRLSRGAWADDFMRPAMAGITFAIPSLAALLALWLGHGSWAPWNGTAALPQGRWLSPSFLFGRDLAALAAFWIVARVFQRARRPGPAAAFTCVLYGLVFSLLGFDLAMALDPQWHSTLFGGYFFISGLYGAVAAWTVLAVAARVRPEGLHDLGRLVVAFSLLTAYLMYVQLLTIWYSNLPGETRFVAARLQAPWSRVSVGLLACIYLGPLVALLTVRAKRRPAFLGAAAIVFLAGLWVERWWLVAPVFDAAPRLGAPEAAAALILGGCFGMGQCLYRGPSAPARLRPYGKGEGHDGGE
jgi:hypothetical protein